MGRKENLSNAKENYKNIVQEISSNREKWKEFLEFSSKFYKYSFTENLLMYAQNPNVTMCATLEEWNSIGRWIKPHSKSLKILRDTENDVSLDYVFDVSDTYARKDIINAYTDEKLQIFKWNATEQQAIQILNDYFHYENIDKLETAVAGYITTAIDDSGLLLNLTDEEELLVLRPEFLELVIKNTTYQVATRCGIKIEDTERLFAEYETFANPTAINVIGNCINYCSSELLKIIEYKIKEIKREELKYANTREIWNNVEKEYEGTISNEVQRVDNRGNIDGQTIREGTRNIETKGNNREELEGKISSTKDTRIYGNDEVQSDDRELSTRRSTETFNRENLKDEKGVEQTTSFSLPKNEVSEELINKVLAEGGNVENSVKRLKEILSDDTLDKKQQIIAVRNEYGDSGIYGKEYSWESRAKGLTISDKTTNVEITLTWADVVKRMKQVFHIQNEQLGFETLFNLSYQQDEIIEKEDNTKYNFITDLIDKKITIDNKEYKVSKFDIDKKEIELYDQSIKGWFPIVRLMNLDEFVVEYSKSNNPVQDEEIIEETKTEKINYELSTEVEKKSLRQRANDNITAIKLLKQIESENRFATKEEQNILAQYSGWGGLSKVFDKRAVEWQVQETELRENLTDEEYVEAKASSLNAFYTNTEIIDSMYLGLTRLGFKGGKILEPSARYRKFYRQITK